MVIGDARLLATWAPVRAVATLPEARAVFGEALPVLDLPLSACRRPASRPQMPRRTSCGGSKPRSGWRSAAKRPEW